MQIAGYDVAKATLDVTISLVGVCPKTRRFDNCTVGFEQLVTNPGRARDFAKS